MNTKRIKDQFSIKDLENISGIKAHTLRIWEKRYNLLQPERSDTNIRYYSLENLQMLLNITLLYNNGVKISKIAKLSQEEIIIYSKSFITKSAVKNQFINDCKIAMLNFDLPKFEKAYQNLCKSNSFNQIFVEYFIPFLNELGLLWQVNSINPAHEHFITTLIKQKIMVNIELNQQSEPTRDEVFILFLPDNEIHELGITYLNYELIVKGFKTVYLGQSLPIECLLPLRELITNPVYISYFTVEPQTNKIDKYLLEIHDKILDGTQSQLWVLGRKTAEISKDKLPNNIRIFEQIPDILEYIDKTIISKTKKLS